MFGLMDLLNKNQIFNKNLFFQKLVFDNTCF